MRPGSAFGVKYFYTSVYVVYFKRAINIFYSYVAIVHRCCKESDVIGDLYRINQLDVVMDVLVVIVAIMPVVSVRPGIIGVSRINRQAVAFLFFALLFFLFSFFLC